MPDHERLETQPPPDEPGGRATVPMPPKGIATRSRPGHLVVLSGPSGVGKTTLLKRLFERCRLPLKPSISATTRSARKGECDGKDYYFLSPEEFARRRERGEFLECCEVYGRGHWYGTLASEVLPSLEAGWFVVLEIDVQGAMAILEKFPSAVTIFIRPSSWQDLEARLRGRATENEAQIERRLEVARRELACADRYQYQVTNTTVDEAADQICSILERTESGHD